MARAGYCSACGNYVFLRPDGGCGNGHGPEYVSNPYDVPDAAPVAAQPVYQQAPPQPAYQQPAPAYAAQPAYTAAAAPPKKKRTGLVVAIVVIVLLLLCCCGAGIALALGAIPNPLELAASPEHQKVRAAGDFFKAMSTADLAGLTRTLPAAAVAAADATFWTEKVLSATDKATFDGESWNGDELTQTFTDSDGAKRTVRFTAIDGDKVRVVLADGSSDTRGVISTVKEGAGWKVLAFGDENGEEFLRFTPEGIKAIQDQSQ